MVNKTAVVTGGSRGIGLAIAKKLAEGGANIAILYVGDESEGINAKAELEKYGTKVIAKLPIDTSLAKCTDTGTMELFVGDYFENAADEVEKI